MKDWINDINMKREKSKTMAQFLIWVNVEKKKRRTKGKLCSRSFKLCTDCNFFKDINS